MARALLPTDVPSRARILGVSLLALVARRGAAAEPFTCGPDDRIASDAPMVAVERIEVASAPVPAVILELSDAAEPLARMLAATGRTPGRIYLDVPNASFDPAVAPVLGGKKPIVRVRSGRFGATARIVVELSRPTSYGVGISGRTVTIALDHPDPVTRSPIRVARRRAPVRTVARAPEPLPDATAVPDACLVADAPTPPPDEPAPAVVQPPPPAPEPVRLARPAGAREGAERLSLALDALGAADDPLLRHAATVLGRAAPAR